MVKAIKSSLSNNSARIQVGTFKVTQPRKVTQHFECALWHQTVECSPGEYPVFVDLTWVDINEGTLGNSLYALFEGVVTEASFQPRIGAHVGEDEVGKDLVGKRETGMLRLGKMVEGDSFPEELILDKNLVTVQPWISQDGKKFSVLRLNREGFKNRNK